MSSAAEFVRSFWLALWQGCRGKSLQLSQKTGLGCENVAFNKQAGTNLATHLLPREGPEKPHQAMAELRSMGWMGVAHG